MIVVMKIGATESEIRNVVDSIKQAGCDANLDRGVERTVIGVRTGRHDLSPEMFIRLPGVQDAVRIRKPFKLASTEFHPTPTIFTVGGVTIGDGSCVVMAGPCSIESEEQIMTAAAGVKKSGAKILRGGAFKPRSSPYAFQGMGEEGLRLLSTAGKEHGLPVVTEVMDPRSVELVGRYADIFQVGARNMQNYDLLRELAGIRKPVLLKRGLSATIEEMLLSAEYLLAGGADKIILCERGIRTYETATRNTLDISLVPVVQSLSHLPVAVDPSHACGVAAFVPPLALSALAAGADCLLVEVHPNPSKALCDGAQSLTLEAFDKLMQRLRLVGKALDREI